MPRQQRKRKIGKSDNSSANAHPTSNRQQSQQLAPVVQHLAKRVRRLEKENKRLLQVQTQNMELQARLVSAENAIQRLQQQSQLQRGSWSTRGATRHHNLTIRRNHRTCTKFRNLNCNATDRISSSDDTATLQPVRQRLNSPRQFYLTLLAMYCSAFAHIVHGPRSKKPILTKADSRRESKKLNFLSKASATANDNENTQTNQQYVVCLSGTAPAGADTNAPAKYERMLRASSHGLWRLVQFRRKIVQRRAQHRRRAAQINSARFKIDGRDPQTQWE